MMEVVATIGAISRAEL